MPSSNRVVRRSLNSEVPTPVGRPQLMQGSRGACGIAPILPWASTTPKPLAPALPGIVAQSGYGNLVHPQAAVVERPRRRVPLYPGAHMPEGRKIGQPVREVVRGEDDRGSSLAIHVGHEGSHAFLGYEVESNGRLVELHHHLWGV